METPTLVPSPFPVGLPSLFTPLLLFLQAFLHGGIQLLDISLHVPRVPHLLKAFDGVTLTGDETVWHLPAGAFAAALNRRNGGGRDLVCRR